MTAARVNGVAWIMKDQNKYAIVKDYEIKNIRIFLSKSNPQLNEPIIDFKVGQAVKVIQGPFKGLQGTSLQNQSEFRLRIEICSLGSSFTVNVAKNQLEEL